MKTNLHTHTWRCSHARGTEREYVERAIEGGMQVLGFSDHTPYPFPGDYYSDFRMRPEQLEGYVDTVLGLKKEYAGDIEIRLGLEAEYYPAYFESLLKLLEPYPMEYLILGQHMIGNEIGGQYCGRPTDDPEVLRTYCAQSIEALKTGQFLYFAHPDLIHFTGDAALYCREMRHMCEEIKALDIPVEINLLGLSTHRNYPNDAFWKIAGQVGCRVVLGADAHDPQRVYAPEEDALALQWAQRYALRLEKAWQNGQEMDKEIGVID